MSSKKQQGKRAQKAKSNPPVKVNSPATSWRGILFGGAGIVVLSAVLVGFFLRTRSGTAEQSKVAEAAYVPKPAGTITFTRDVAPIVFENCAPCHRPGQSAPFSLLTFADYKKHLDQISDVVASRYMPPWPPEHGYGEFAHERRLSNEQQGLIEQWITEGGKEGDPQLLPSLPQWNESWTLGKPDLVVTLSKPYQLAAEGRDVYHNFVIPIPLARNRYVKAVELLPGNARVVHHAFINIDTTQQSRRLAARQDPPGFDGMEVPESAITPGGQLLSWQPGKITTFAPPGLAWELRTNTDLVLQAHFNPSGKPEVVQPSVGFYFTDEPPTNSPFRIKLTALELDIPAGNSNYVVKQSYKLPVDVQLTRVGAHAHYLGKDLQGYAILPNGEKKWLLRIKDWNFKWQGDYEYAQPVFLPRGSELFLDFTYDNSTNNPRNPSRPPVPVRYGLQTKDEMGELYFQALATNQQDYMTLARDYSDKLLNLSIGFFRYRLRHDPADVEANIRLGRILMAQGEKDQGAALLMKAVAADPNSDQAHYELGLWHLGRKDLDSAFAEFQTASRLNPGDSQALGNLGYIALRRGQYAEAVNYFENALQVNPEDEIARKYLLQLRQVR